jgi:hypothetical protein
MVLLQTLSTEALSLFHLHVERQGEIALNDSNRPLYEELAAAGLMMPGHSFVGGRNSFYTLTRKGFERKGEIMGCAKEAG